MRPQFSIAPALKSGMATWAFCAQINSTDFLRNNSILFSLNYTRLSQWVFDAEIVRVEVEYATRFVQCKFPIAISHLLSTSAHFDSYAVLARYLTYRLKIRHHKRHKVRGHFHRCLKFVHEPFTCVLFILQRDLISFLKQGIGMWSLTSHLQSFALCASTACWTMSS